MKIDGLVVDTRRRGSTRVSVGGKVAWTVPADLITELGIVDGCQLTGTMIARLEQGADEEGAFRAALRALERRGHAERELVHKLERKGHPEVAVAAAIARLRALGLIDDLAFAEHYVRSRAERGRGPFRLRHDLAALGVAPELINAALSSGSQQDGDPLALPRALATKRAARMAGLPRETRRRRLSAFLARRGYQGEERKRIVDEALGA